MRQILLLILLLPFSLYAKDKKDSLYIELKQKICTVESKNNQIDSLKKEIVEIKSKFENQDKLNDKTLNSISNQLEAASYNLTLFGILFALAALGIGIYVTYIERKIVNLKEENNSLLNQTIKTKDEVVSINNLIQKDIYGLFLKIKREETVHILNRLLIIPEDITNLIHQLLSRELEKDDFKILKQAYFKIKELPNENKYKDSYKVLFFQHFLDLSIKDRDICNDLFEFYSTAINCAFENDIIKSTQDFMKAIIDLGYKSRVRDINYFIKGLSNSSFKSLETVYKIIFNGLRNRDDQFKFFDLISDEKENRIGKSNYGKILIETYSSMELSLTEKSVIEKTKDIIAELDKEEQEKNTDEKKNI